MTITTSEAVLDAIQLTLEMYFGPDGEWTGDEVMVDDRNGILPEEIPAGGYIVLRDGDPGDPEFALGFQDEGPFHYSHRFEIELHVENSDAVARDAAYAALLAGIGAALNEDRTLGGIAAGMQIGAPSALTRPILGGDDLKSATLKPLIDYDTATPI